MLFIECLHHGTGDDQLKHSCFLHHLHFLTSNLHDLIIIPLNQRDDSPFQIEYLFQLPTS